jgi:hypothetical protein
MKLTQEEMDNVNSFQEQIKELVANLGGVLRHYKSLESSALSQIDKVENEYMSYIKLLAKSKGMKENENWIFDRATQSFRKE